MRHNTFICGISSDEFLLLKEPGVFKMDLLNRLLKNPCIL